MPLEGEYRPRAERRVRGQVERAEPTAGRVASTLPDTVPAPAGHQVKTECQIPILLAERAEPQE